MSFLTKIRLVPTRAIFQTRFVHTEPEPVGVPLPKAEKNPAYKSSSVSLPAKKQPEPISGTPILSDDHHTLPPTLSRATAFQSVDELRPVRALPNLPELIKEDRIVQPINNKNVRPAGAIKGGLLGFLLGITLVGGFGYVKLFEEYKTASNLLLMSVEELRASTTAMSVHLKRIEVLETELKTLGQVAAVKKDLESQREEYKSLSSSIHLDLLDLKSHIWSLESDLNAKNRSL